MFDAQTLNTVYKDVINAMTSHFEIEVSVLENIGKEFVLHSGSHKLITKNGRTEVIENGLWQGTLIYMEIGTGEEIDPSQIVDHRADELKQHTTFKGLNPLAERSVLVALQRRYKVIKGS